MADVPLTKKIKVEQKDDADKAADDALEQTIFQQNEIFHEYRDSLAQLELKHLNRILNVNKQDIIDGTDETGVRNQCADIMTFGALEKCTKCQGQFVFNKWNYICTGDLSEWAKCDRMTTEPKRRVCQLPSELLTGYPELKVSHTVQHRALRYVPPSDCTLLPKNDYYLE